MIKNIFKNKIILSIILIIFLLGSVFLIQKFLIPYIHYMLLPREKIDLSGIDKATICFYEGIYLEETDEYVRNKLFEIDYKIPNTLAEGLQKNKFINYNNDNTVSVLDDFKQPNHEVILNSHNKFYFHYVYEWANSLSKDSNRNSYVTWYNDDKSFKTSVPTYFITSLVVDIDDFLETNYEENCLKNITKIRIIKKEYGSEKRLKDVKFNLLDLNKNVIKENLITDENGEIIIDELFPGKYYIQETETLEGYNLYKDLIPVDIKFNEEIEIIVNNTTKSKSEITNEVNTIQVLQKETETKNTITKKLPVTGC